MPIRKVVFSDELRQKYPCFNKGCSDFEAECSTCGYGTFISVANKDGISFDDHIKTTKHKQSITGETSSFKVTEHFCKLVADETCLLFRKRKYDMPSVCFM